MNSFKLHKVLYTLAGILLLASACFREEDFFTQYAGEGLDLLMTQEQEEQIYSSRGNQFLIDDPLPTLAINNVLLDVDRFKIRGQNTLNFRKKSFSVNLDKPIEWRMNNCVYHAENFKLLSMVYDYTYIENRVALKLHEEIGLWPLQTFYTEVKINGNHNGLYLFVADPEEYFLDYLNEAFILRREYGNEIRRFEKNELDIEHSDDFYIAKYDSVYTLIKNFEGEELYHNLSTILDLEKYFRKLAVDFLIRNGDTTDEIFFYTTLKNGKLVYAPLPWDCDDIFSEFPHEIGREWGTGKLFGNRYYNSTSDVIADVGEVLLFSIEEDLDYKIATDAYMYQKYLKQASYVATLLSEEVIGNIFNEVYDELEPFYQNLDLETLSQYDEQATNYQKWIDYLNVSKQLVLNQRKAMILKLN